MGKQMSVDRYTCMAQQKELLKYADELTDIHTKLMRYKSEINVLWKSHEVDILNDTIDRVGWQIKRVKEEINSISLDIVRAVDEIEADEKIALEKGKKEQAKKEAQLKAEKERLEKEKAEKRLRELKKKEEQERIKKEELERQRLQKEAEENEQISGATQMINSVLEVLQLFK